MQRQEKSCDHRFTAGAVRRVDPAHRTGRYVLGAQRGVETSYLWSPGNGWFLFQGWSPGMACVYDVRRGGGWRSVARARYLDALGRNRAGSARRGSHHLGPWSERLGVYSAGRRLEGSPNQTAFPQKAALDGVGSHKNIGRLGLESVFGRAQKAEPFL